VTVEEVKNKPDPNHGPIDPNSGLPTYISLGAVMTAIELPPGDVVGLLNRLAEAFTDIADGSTSDVLAQMSVTVANPDTWAG